jgi:hypothetical protein
MSSNFKIRAKTIFVFGSNLQGRHGKGAALTAMTKYGAEPGVGEGRTGNAYAIPTKMKAISERRQLPLSEIKKSVERFLKYASDNPDLTFHVTRIGCGLAGYIDAEIAPMFRGYNINVLLPDIWVQILTATERIG